MINLSQVDKLVDELQLHHHGALARGGAALILTLVQIKEELVALNITLDRIKSRLG
jgi:hypothetical protein